MIGEQIPPGCYEVEVECFNCGQKFLSHTEANISDPETLALVKRLMRIVLCNTCHAHQRGAATFTGPNYAK